MLVFNVGEETHFCPESLADIKFWQFLKYCDVLKDRPEILADLDKARQVEHNDSSTADEFLIAQTAIKKIEKALKHGRNLRDLIAYKIKIVDSLTTLTSNIMLSNQGINIDSLDILYQTALNALDTVIEDDSREFGKFEFESENYYVTDSKHQTLGEILQAAQCEEICMRMSKGNAAAMLDIVSVFLRKEGESYSDEVFERNKAKFIELDMQTVWEVSNFFQKKNERLLLDANVFFLIQELLQTMAEREKLTTDLSGT